MRLKFFWIPALDSAAAEQEANAFLASHRVVQVDRHFQPSPTQPGWSLCVQWLPGPETGPGRAGAEARPDKVDYRAILDAPTFQIFSALRTWRKATATSGGVPVYTVATNEQLADIARRRVQTRAALEQIEGFGSGRMERYADELVALCCREIAALPGGQPSIP
jgi:superfamily II DNA helicase RecQ